MTKALIDQLNELIFELAEDGYMVTVIATGNGKDFELTANPSRIQDQSKSSVYACLH